jgi:hypothetical protein
MIVIGVFLRDFRSMPGPRVPGLIDRRDLTPCRLFVAQHCYLRFSETGV